MAENIPANVVEAARSTSLYADRLAALRVGEMDMVGSKNGTAQNPEEPDWLQVADRNIMSCDPHLCLRVSRVSKINKDC